MLTFDSKFFLQIKRTAMGTVFTSTYAYLVMTYHEIKISSIICQSHTLANKHFETFWFRFLNDSQILLKVNLIKPEPLLSILKEINNIIQLTMEKSQTRLPFLDVMINKSGTKISINIYNKTTDSKRYVPFMSHYPQHCLANIPFSLAGRICTTMGNEHVKKNALKKWKKNVVRSKIP